MTVCVETISGLVEGIKENDGIAFLGIPYGKAERFERCRPFTWEGVYKGNQYSQVAPQLEEGQPIGDEECLTLNVYTPNLDGHYPVLVEIHGGAFQMGSNQGMTRSISNGQEIVHIGINYRLGAFVFLSIGETTGGDGIDTGNLGLDDQQMALRWIYKNCHRFGGDATRITVMGNSAGAKSIGAHLVSGRVKDIIDGVILSSGATQSIRDVRTARVLAEEFGHVVMNLYGANEEGPSSWRTLVKKLTTGEMLEAQRQWCDGRHNTCFFGPVADGVLIDVDWISAWQNNKHHIRRLMLGSNQHECIYYMEEPRLEEERTVIMRDLFGAQMPLVEEAYQKLLKQRKGVSAKEVLMDCLSDYMYGLHTHQLALDCQKESDVYYYRFGFGNGAHALDMRVLSGDSTLRSEYTNQEDAINRIQETMLKAYRDFAKGERPFPAFDDRRMHVSCWGFTAHEDTIQKTYDTMDSRMRQVIRRL